MSGIVYGGGWHDKREERLKVKAWVFLFGAIFAGAVTAVLDDDSAWAVWLTASSLGCFMISVVLFFVERPRGIGWLGMPNGGDLHKLYGVGGGNGEHVENRPVEDSGDRN